MASWIVGPRLHVADLTSGSDCSGCLPRRWRRPALWLGAESLLRLGRVAVSNPRCVSPCAARRPALRLGRELTE